MNLDSFRAAALVAVALAAGCGDAPTDPAALLVAEHARAALDVSVPLPSLAHAETMDRAQFDGVLTDLGIWLDAAEARLEMESGARPDVAALRAEVAAGRAALTEAAALEGAGDRDGAIAALRGAEARLFSTTAHAVAAQRIAAAAGAEERCGAARDPLIDQDISVRRGRRLLAHAREAMEEGDVEIAIQRAHYAEAMLAAGCPAAPPANGVDR